jgi:cupin 2 domain-containing protein
MGNVNLADRSPQTASSPWNLLADLPQHLAGERVDLLLRGRNLRVERIVSTGHASPADFWYDQAQAEWVVLLQGSASLQLAGESQPRRLEAGDSLLIPAGCRHRVEWTSDVMPTVWLAIFFDETE